jgi:hypothetical protein
VFVGDHALLNHATPGSWRDLATFNALIARDLNADAVAP